MECQESFDTLLSLRCAAAVYNVPSRSKCERFGRIPGAKPKSDKYVVHGGLSEAAQLSLQWGRARFTAEQALTKTERERQ